MILYKKCSKSPLLTLSFLCVEFYIRVFDDIAMKVFQKGSERVFKMLKKGFFLWLILFFFVRIADSGKILFSLYKVFKKKVAGTNDII